MSYEIACEKKDLLALKYIDAPLSYQLITESFYQDATNQLTDENLQMLAHFATTIDEPVILGEFQNEAHYLKTLQLVLKSTHETRNLNHFFLKKIIPIVITKNNLLDIGPGDGSLTSSIAQYFNHLTAVDLNSKILDDLSDILSCKTEYAKLPVGILGAQLMPDHYDLAVLSHVLYYIPPEKWFEVVKKTYNSLKQNGILVIALGGDERGKAELIRTFAGVKLGIDQLAVNCIDEFSSRNVDLYASEEVFITFTIQAMLHIAAFMLRDVDVQASKHALIDYINSKMKKSDDRFVMTSRQKFIVIRKNINL